MTIRFYNAYILTMQPGCCIFMGEVHVKDDTIAFVGTSGDSEYKNIMEFDREIDVRGNLLMPGFKDAHTHSPMTFLRSYADDMPLQKWLYEKVFPLEARLDDESVYYFTKLAIMEYLTSGITSCFDMYSWQESMASAAADCGFRYVVCGTVNDFKDSAEKQEELYLKINKISPLVSYRMGIHAEYTTSYRLLNELACVSRKYNAPVYMHNSETRKETDDCIKKYGLTPTGLFDDIGLFDYGGGGFHCVYLTDNDIDIFRNKKLYVITNPASNAKLASGIAPITKILENNIPVAIGTDGPASNNCLDMFREMYLVTALQKLQLSDASACPPELVLDMAAVKGAHAMGLENNDTIKFGNKADIILIDLSQPNMQPQGNIIRNIVYSGSKQNVYMTMVNGKILYMNGEFFIDEEKEYIYKKVNRLFSDIIDGL